MQVQRYKATSWGLVQINSGGRYIPWLYIQQQLEDVQEEAAASFSRGDGSTPTPSAATAGTNANHMAHNIPHLREPNGAGRQQPSQTTADRSPTSLGQPAEDVAAVGAPPSPSPGPCSRSPKGRGVSPDSLGRNGESRYESRLTDKGPGGGGDAEGRGRSEVRLVDKGGAGEGAAEGGARGVAVFHACMVPPRVTSLSGLKAAPSTNNKKKGKASGGRLSELAEAAGRSLREHGWAVVDNFVNFDQVTKVCCEPLTGGGIGLALLVLLLPGGE